MKASTYLEAKISSLFAPMDDREAEEKKAETLKDVRAQHDRKKEVIRDILSTWDTLNDEEQEFIMGGLTFKKFLSEIQELSVKVEKPVVAVAIPKSETLERPDDPGEYYFQAVWFTDILDDYIPLALFDQGRRIW